MNTPPQPSTPAPPQPPAPRPGPPALTWFRLHAGVTLVDFPLRVPPQADVWVATMWPDERSAAGWARQPWQAGPERRGFVPTAVELGDVIQFGAQPATGQPARDPRRAAVPGGVYWHGYLHAVGPDHLLIHGPHPGPWEAHAAAQQALLTRLDGEQPSRQPAHREGHQLSAPNGRTATPLAPAQPPASVSVTFHGPSATVGDPVHGWIVIPTEHLLTAMSFPPQRQLAIAREHVPLTGREPQLTVAALAARHAGPHLPHSQQLRPHPRRIPRSARPPCPQRPPPTRNRRHPNPACDRR